MPCQWIKYFLGEKKIFQLSVFVNRPGKDIIKTLILLRNCLEELLVSLYIRYKMMTEI